MLPIDVHIHTNTHCNLRCIHCYEDTDSMVAKSIDGDFETSLIQQLCDNFDANIHLEGGEIFLEETLFTALLSLSSSARRHLTITTNGTIHTDSEEVIDALASIGCLRVSVEGHTDELQKAIRGCGLATVLENALFYKSKGVQVVLRITANRLNYTKMFHEVIPSLQEKGFDDFQIYEMQPVGRGKTSSLCINEPLIALYEDWLHHPSNAKIKVSLPHKRKSEIVAYISRFGEIGITAYEIGDIPSISIGVDSAVRICPWDMDSAPLLMLNEVNLVALSEIIHMQTHPHVCDYCSHIVLKGCGHKC
jgi:sulfatase maturation enzyme AslB (radical SAM superfamily)